MYLPMRIIVEVTMSFGTRYQPMLSFPSATGVCSIHAKAFGFPVDLSVDKSLNVNEDYAIYDALHSKSSSVDHQAIRISSRRWIMTLVM